MKKLKAVVPAGEQYSGLGAIVAGVYLLVGEGWALLVAGVLLVVLGALREGGRI